MTRPRMGDGREARTVTISTGVSARMKEYGASGRGVNWSAVAEEAFVREMEGGPGSSGLDDREISLRLMELTVEVWKEKRKLERAHVSMADAAEEVAVLAERFGLVEGPCDGVSGLDSRA